jgi:peptidoglycan/LPS O-acetylase OafA/YrhL
MSRALSVYLDLLRFTAAMTVFLGHISGQRFTGGLFWQFGPFMDEAVTVFFVLSGYVIGYVLDGRERSAEAYIVARAARILSVAVPAIVVTLILDSIGRTIQPEFYSTAWGYQPSGQIWQFLGALFFVNQLWYMEIGVGSNLPYWSLCYEVWYYIIFGVAIFAPVRWRVPATLALLLLVGPRIAALFPVWLIGIAAYRISASGRISKGLGTGLAGGGVVLLLALEIGKWHLGPLPQLLPDFLQQPRATNDLAVGILFAAHLVGFQRIAERFEPMLGALAGPIRWCAGATFTVYLFHLPICQFLTTVVPWPPGAWQTRLVMLCGAMAIMLAIAEVTERRKTEWRGFVLRIIRGAGHKTTA